MCSFCNVFSKSISVYAIFNDQNFNDTLTNDIVSYEHLGVVGWCEGAVYLTSLGRPTDIGLQLGKACYPCSG